MSGFAASTFGCPAARDSRYLQVTSRSFTFRLLRWILPGPGCVGAHVLCRRSGMVRKLRATVAVTAVVGIILGGRSLASELVTIDFPGAVLTNVFGVNPEGDVVGRYLGADGRFHGFVAKNGVFTP